MRPDRVVFLSPLFNQDLSLSQGIEDLPVEPLIPQLAVEGIDCMNHGKVSVVFSASETAQ
jgi:hypothetical protein